MRTLKFIVKDQTITQDPSCDFSGLVPGSAGYLRAEFDFSSEWANCTKVVGFYSSLGIEYPPQVLKDGKSCVIPSEALQKREFRVRVIGRRRDFNIATNTLAVRQDGGRK